MSVCNQSRGDGHHYRRYDSSPLSDRAPQWSTLATPTLRSGTTRGDFLQRYGDQPVLVIGTHFAAPTAGHIVKDGNHTDWITRLSTSNARILAGGFEGYFFRTRGAKFPLAVDWQFGFILCHEHADHRAWLVSVCTDLIGVRSGLGDVVLHVAVGDFLFIRRSVGRSPTEAAGHAHKR